MDSEILGDRYEMQDAIGRGGMATIYRAVDLRMGRTVAVKILREVYSSDPKFVTRFQREARAASLLQHPNIVQVFDYGQSGESYYIVMEFVDGTDLRRYLKRTGKLSSERAVTIARDVALGLGAAHKRGIVHRDVKPQNIMLNDADLVKLTDFGIASVYKDAGAERLTTTGMTLGTVQYYAPEQAQGEVVTPAADIYALGIVMYEMLTGRPPFDGDTPVAVAMKHIQEPPEPPTTYNPSIAPGLERIIMRCLEKDPRDRFRDGDALAYALDNLDRRQSGRPAAPAAGRAGAPLSLPSDARGL
ncbi:MAG TPA: protein kinase, partial [Ktedonobacterales bacterium]|nr:protein kinase [Ktedonobacterales bacterium]